MPNYPKISLKAASLTPATYQAAVFTPQKEDMSLLQRSMQTLDERKMESDKQRAAIMSAIGSLKLAPEEDKWKFDYANRIANRIDNAAQFGDYSTALEVATRMAGESITSPEVVGRLRYNEDRQKFLEELKDRNTRKEIDSDTYQRAIAQNPYQYSDTYGANGNIVGGSAWKPAFNPVRDVDLTQVMAEMYSLVRPSSTASSRSGGTSQIYVDKSGNKTTNMDEARGIFATVSGGGGSSSRSGISAKEWAEAYDAWVSANPDAIQAFEQKRQNALWRYNQYNLQATDMNLSEVERNNAKATADKLYKQLTDKDGAWLSSEHYARNLVSSMFDAMAYSNISSSSEGGSTLLNEDLLHNKVQADILGINPQQSEVYSAGSPIEKIAILKGQAQTTAGLTQFGYASLKLLQDGFTSSSWGNR